MKINTAKEQALLHDTLVSVLQYDPDTGKFTYNLSRGSRSKGQVAGSLHGSGYRYIELNNYGYAEHRLAWFYSFKEWPEGSIDHIDRVKDNNILDNLRDVSHSDNMRNKSIGVNNTSGFLGVSFYRPTSRWKASYVLDGKPKHIGYYDTPEEASLAYIEYKNKS